MDSLFENCGYVSSGILNISPREAFELCSKGALIVDVRVESVTGYRLK
jgi:hypothetical protein